MKSRALLLTTAIVWGLAFVAQRQGMEHVPPFAFNAVRFALGFLVLLPFALFRHEKQIETSRRTFWLGGLATGIILFIAASLQQIGVVYTTAGKAGFITGLYVIIVPLMGLALKHRVGWWIWLGAVVGVAGLYLLTVTESLTIEYGDLLVLIGAFFWAAHVHMIGHFSARIGAIRLSLMQIALCSLISFGVALACETIRMDDLLAGAVPILYAGVLSVGMAYTLQVIGQQGTPPAQAALILCLETVFAVLGGWVLLSETMPVRGLIGCALMFAGMIVSQLDTQT